MLFEPYVRFHILVQFGYWVIAAHSAYDIIHGIST